MDYWRTYLWRDAVRRIITINTIVWIIVGVWLLIWGKNTDVNHLAGRVFAVSADVPTFLTHCWTAFTYMWVQYDFLHLLANMLWLMLFGDLLVPVLTAPRLVTVYIIGGLCGAAAFVAYTALVPQGSPTAMVGASCAVLAISGVALVMMPNWTVSLFIFGRVKVLWIVIVAVVLFVILAPRADVCMAHAAGLAFGMAYGALKKRGHDLAQPFVRLLNRPRRRPSKSVNARKGSATPAEEQEFDQLLSKVSRSGYDSLSASERQRLFNLSQRVKK